MIAGLKMARSLGIKKILVHTDSQLVSSQISGEFQTKDERMASYVAIASGILQSFEYREIININRNENTHTDALATLASAMSDKKERVITVEYVPSPSIEAKARVNIVTDLPSEPSWMDPIIEYHRTGDLPGAGR